MIESPKTRFLQNDKDTKRLLDLTADSQFLRACDFAMLQFLQRLVQVDDPIVSAANCHRMEGAKMFRDILLTLAEQEKPVQPVLGHNLNHRV